MKSFICGDWHSRRDSGITVLGIIDQHLVATRPPRIHSPDYPGSSMKTKLIRDTVGD